MSHLVPPPQIRAWFEAEPERAGKGLFQRMQAQHPSIRTPICERFNGGLSNKLTFLIAGPQDTHLCTVKKRREFKRIGDFGANGWGRYAGGCPVIPPRARVLDVYAPRIYESFVTSWDERKRQRNLKDHGIDLADLEEFFDGDLLTREDKRQAYGEVRFQSVGMINDVALFVVWTPRGENSETAHLISARKAEKHEHKAWLARYAKR